MPFVRVFQNVFGTDWNNQVSYTCSYESLVCLVHVFTGNTHQWQP